MKWAWLGLVICWELWAQVYVLKASRIIDGRSDRVLENHGVIVEGETIQGLSRVIPKGARVIDLGPDSTILPGLIDAHVHLLIGDGDYQYAHLQKSSAEKALHGLHAAQKLLRAGWTTLRVAGDADVFYAPHAIRKSIEQEKFEGPTIVGAAHYLSITGGGGDLNFLSSEQKLMPDGLVVDGPEEILKAIRKEIKFGSDWIKLLVTGAFMSAGDDPKQVHFSREELAAAMDASKRLGIPVMAHAHSAEGVRLAVEAGVKSVEHGSFVNRETLALMKKNGTYLVPTVYIGEYYLEKKSDNPWQKKMIALTRKYRSEYRKNVKTAIEMGVRIGVGSDLGGYEDASINVREILELVKLGMTPMQALKAATSGNAELLGITNIGSVAKGFQADLLAVKGNPLMNLAVLEKPLFVIKGGRIIVSNSLEGTYTP